MEKNEKSVFVFGMILDGIALIFLVVLLCFRQFHACLFSFLGLFFTLFLPLTPLLLRQNDLKEKGSVLLLTNVRLVILIMSALIPSLVWYLVPSLHPQTSLFYLFPGLILGWLYDIGFRIVWLSCGRSDRKS